MAISADSSSKPAKPRLFVTSPTGAERGRVRLRTLSNLRWLAIGGQSAALFLVYFAFGYSLPLGYCAIAIAISATLTCSPVDNSMSISLAGGSSVISLARSISRSVFLPIALTTMTT